VANQTNVGDRPIIANITTGRRAIFPDKAEVGCRQLPLSNGVRVVVLLLFTSHLEEGKPPQVNYILSRLIRSCTTAAV
jgi:hypothetical protein